MRSQLARYLDILILVTIIAPSPAIADIQCVCGAIIHTDNAVTCPNCGRQLTGQERRVAVAQALSIDPLGIGVTAGENGVVVERVDESGPSASILRIGDVIVGGVTRGTNGTPRDERVESMQDLKALLDRVAAGEEIMLSVRRTGERGFETHDLLLRSEVVDGVSRIGLEDLYGDGAPQRTRTYSVVRSDPERANYSVVTVYYGTDRLLENGKYCEKRGIEQYGIEQYGRCEVAIPRDHRFGELEEAKWWRFELRNDPNKHVTLQRVFALPKEALFDEVKTKLSQRPKRRAFVFVHGFNVTFEDAARRTAQMTADLGFDGAAFFYSWPSNGTTGGYVADGEDIKWSVPHIKAFLADIVRRTEVEELFVIAHSMGSRGLSQALVDLDEGERGTIKEIILAAPDIDAEIFSRDIVPKIVSGYGRITVYASSKDKALGISKWLQDYPRAGQIVGGKPVLPLTSGLEVVDASDVETGFGGHGYYGDGSEVLKDVKVIWSERKKPTDRPRLTRVAEREGEFWRFVVD